MKQSGTCQSSNLSVFVFVLILAITAMGATRARDNSQRVSSKTAVIIDPVVDVGIHAVPGCNQPASPESQRCFRAHQGLHNELVSCIEEDDVCVKIACDTIIYGFEQSSKKPLNTFWTAKKHLVLLDDLPSNLLATIPHPMYAQEPTIVLVYPWNSYSVGTRFKHVAEHDTSDAYAIMRAHYQTQSVTIDFVPHESALQEIKQTSSTARKIFVDIVNKLVDRVSLTPHNFVIPYVWGGSSFVCPYKDGAFYQQDGVWQREGLQEPYSGYDCSEFVMRMARIAGLDFPWKTTGAMHEGLKELLPGQTLEEGDLIWTSGHVMIVTNIERNELIHARGYASGYGCVHRTTLSEFFDGVVTYDDLLQHCWSLQPIKIKNKQGVVGANAMVFKILKLVE